MIRVGVFLWSVALVSEDRGVPASRAAETLSQLFDSPFSCCSSVCSQPQPSPRVSRCYVTAPAGSTEGTRGDSDRHGMIWRTEGMREVGREGAMERKKEDVRRAVRGMSEIRMTHNSRVLFPCQLGNKENRAG